MLSDNQLIRLIFGFKVRYLRQQHGRSYQELSDQTGLSTSYLNDIEKGKRYPKPDKITAIAEALGVDYNYMVATNASKKLQPIIDLLSSNFFKFFPLHEFGLSLDKILELFTQTPDKVTAFISTIFKLARNYQVDEITFYKEALRSYQDMHNNYFADLEQAAQTFKQEYSIRGILPYTSAFLSDQLIELYDVEINHETLHQYPKLRHLRSFFKVNSRTLYIQSGLSEAQVNFLLAREIGFQYLQLTERPYTTTIVKIDSFEELLNNFKASYFAAALLMDEKSMVQDIKTLSRSRSWQPHQVFHLLSKYNVTGEMFVQRLTNILPHHFELEDLFFLRLQEGEKPHQYQMTKDLHLSQLHSPYNNELEEHYCQRWISITAIQALTESQISPTKEHSYHIDAQISKYWNTDKQYLCISISKPTFSQPEKGTSITLGLLITPTLRSHFYFLTDPDLNIKEVHTTCERCGILDCTDRVAPPTIITRDAQLAEVLVALKEIP